MIPATTCGLPPMRNPPPHREVSVAVISMEAMGWPGLGDMVPSTRRQWRDARRVTSPRHNHGGGAALDESRLVVAMAAETTSGCGRDTLRRISQAPPSSARTRVTRAGQCKVAASTAIGGGVCGHRWMCVHHVSHIHSFLLLYSTSTPAGHTPRTSSEFTKSSTTSKSRPTMHATSTTTSTPLKADEARRRRRAWPEQRPRFRRRVYHSVHHHHA